MRVLITGADGMIGHALWRYFNEQSAHETFAAVRSDRRFTAFGKASDGGVIRTGALDGDGVIANLFETAMPDVVINCAGVTKHADFGNDPITVIRSNSLVPQMMAHVAAGAGTRLIQISTDCVFLGDKGSYAESDAPDADDLYGRSKVLGEIADQSHVLTIRTSIVGFEIGSRRGLLEWFLTQQGQCRGFQRAIFSGVTTLSLAGTIDRYILSNPSLTGLLHVAGPRIDKYSLLGLFREHFGHAIKVVPDSDFAIDRSLDGSRFCGMTGYSTPSWNSMLADLVAMGR